MGDEDRDEDESIFKVKTIPPPDGDGDAYNAPTRVGPASADEWAKLIRQADAQGKKSAEAMQQAPESAQPKREGGPPSSSRSGATATVTATAAGGAPARIEEVPRIYSGDGDSEDGDESNDATAKGPQSSSLATLATPSGPMPAAPQAPAVSTDAPFPAAAPLPAAPLATAPQASASEPFWRKPRSLLAVTVAVCLTIFLVGVVSFLLQR